MKRFYILLLSIVFVSLNLSADVEPNDGFTDANSLALDALQLGSLDASDSDDYYKITTPKNGRVLISLNTSASTLNARIYIYNHDGVYVTNSGATTDSTSLSLDCFGKGDLFVRVNRAAVDGNYLLKVEHKPVSLPIDPSEPANNFFATALDLPPNTNETGHLGYSNGSIVPLDNDDYYVSVLPTNGKIKLSAFPTNGLSIRLYLYNAAGVYITNSGASTDSVVINRDCLLSDTLYYRVNRAGGCGSYTVNWSYEGTTYGPDPEPNATFAESMPLEEGDMATGNMGYINASPTDNDDYYRIFLEKDGQIDITLNSFESLSSRIYLYNKDNVYLTNSGAGTAVSLSFNCIKSDSLFIRVNRAGGCGSYDLTYNLTPIPYNDDNEPNDLFANALNLNMNTLKQGHLGYANASATDNDDYYIVDSEAPGDLTFTATFEGGLSGRIYLYNAAGAYITNTGASSDSLSLTYNAPADDNYYVRINRAGGCGSYTVKTENGCPKPKNLRTDPAISIGAILKWNAVAAADKYRLQKRVAGAPTWEPNLNVNIPKYTWYPLTECTDYEFRVESRCGDRNSSFAPIEEFSTLCSPVCFTPGSVFVNATSATTAQIGWSDQPIDVGYKIQYVVDGDFSTIFEKTSTAPMVLLTGLTPGTNYLFRVNAFCLGSGVSGFAFGSFSTTTVREGGSAMGFGEHSGLQIFPNPASEVVSVALNSEASLVEVVNLVGQVVLTEQPVNQNFQLDVSDLEAGLYLVKAYDKNSGSISSTGLIVE